MELARGAGCTCGGQFGSGAECCARQYIESAVNAFNLNRSINRTSFKDGKIGSVPLAEIAGKTKRVSSDNELIKQGERIGISFKI